MKVFMLGWEFPPMVSGGLGVACYGLAKALNGMGIDVMFLLPKPASKSTNGKQQNGLAMVSGATSNGPTMRTLVRVRHVSAPSVAQVHEAVERATHPPARGLKTHSMTERQTPVDTALKLRAATPSSPAPAASTVEESSTNAGDAEQLPLQRVTFMPMDVRLEPYLTPAQYYHMVVEDLAQGGKHQVDWSSRAVAAGAQGPIQQPPNRPAQAGDAPAAAASSTAPASAMHPSRDYIEEPAEASRVIGPADSTYAGDLFSETERYARLALAVARGEKFAVVHAHDWMTFEAAMAVSAASGKPLVVQIHSTELDRAGAQANRRIMEIERKGMTAADRVIAVSYKTRTQLIEKYGIDPRKIEVVYNATDAAPPPAVQPLRKKQKTVLFLGRLTEQKGPDYFLRAARKVVAVEADVKFVVAGKGDMLEDLKKLAAELGIRKKVIFTGFLKKDPVEKAFRSADVYVMPSLSEPFGITPLEALAHDVPVIISKQSGVAEVLKHVLKVDFWDTDDLANKIIAVLRHPPLAETLRQRGHEEVRQLSWDDSAKRIVEMYKILSQQPAMA